MDKEEFIKQFEGETREVVESLELLAAKGAIDSDNDYDHEHGPNYTANEESYRYLEIGEWFNDMFRALIAEREGLPDGEA